MKRRASDAPPLWVLNMLCLWRWLLGKFWRLRVPTTNYRSSTEEIIKDALYLIEALEEGEPLTAEQETQGMRGLSRLIASWQAQSEHVWTQTEGVLALTGAQSYRFGRFTSPAYTGTLRGSFTAPTQPSPAFAQIETFSVAPISTTEFPAGTSIIVTPQGTSVSELPFETTVESTFGGTITLADPLPFSHEGGDLSYGDDLKLALRPLRIIGARRSDTFDGVQIPMNKVSREDYQDQPNKGAASTPVEFYYDAQLEHGTLYVWGTGGSFIHFTYERELLKPTAMTDILDFPEEWFDALIYNLAVRLAPMYALNPVKRQLLKSEAEQLKFDALSADSDEPYMEIAG